jgi:hypothetical protein
MPSVPGMGTDGIVGEGNLRDQAALQRGQTALLLRLTRTAL